MAPAHRPQHVPQAETEGGETVRSTGDAGAGAAEMGQPMTGTAPGDGAAPAAEGEPGAGAVGPRDRARSAPPARRSKSGGVRSLVLSMLVILGLVLAWSALTPETAPQQRPAIDAASSARSIAEQTGWPVRFATTPPTGWRPTSVAYGPSSQGVQVWRLGYHNADDTRYVDVLQTSGSSGRPLDEWVAQVTNHGRQDGEVTVGPTTWTVLRAEGTPARSSLVARNDRGLTSVITGPASVEDLQAFAARLEPVRGS